jgi:hypothetical protein
MSCAEAYKMDALYVDIYIKWIAVGIIGWDMYDLSVNSIKVQTAYIYIRRQIDSTFDFLFCSALTEQSLLPHDESA